MRSADQKEWPIISVVDHRKEKGVFSFRCRYLDDTEKWVSMKEILGLIPFEVYLLEHPEIYHDVCLVEGTQFCSGVRVSRLPPILPQPPTTEPTDDFSAAVDAQHRNPFNITFFIQGEGGTYVGSATSRRTRELTLTEFEVRDKLAKRYGALLDSLGLPGEIWMNNYVEEVMKEPSRDRQELVLEYPPQHVDDSLKLAQSQIQRKFKPLFDECVRYIRDAERQRDRLIELE
ncbi:hypothetical protein ADUPG1_004232, partial [Aduncisulcus paluster]